MQDETGDGDKFHFFAPLKLRKVKLVSVPGFIAFLQKLHSFICVFHHFC